MRGDVGLSGGAGGCIEVQDEVGGEVGGEDERGALDGEDDGGLEEAGDGVGVGGPQRRRYGDLHGGQGDDEDRLGVVEGRWHIEAEVHGLGLGEADGGDVLVLGGVQGTEDADEVDDGADVGGVEATAGEVGVAGGLNEVGVGAVGEGGDEGTGRGRRQGRSGSRSG